MREKRDEIIILRTTKAEKNRIYEKMLGMGIRSLSAYIRKMALDGYCLHLDLKELRRMAYLLQMCSNNLNQYAKSESFLYLMLLQSTAFVFLPLRDCFRFH